MVQKLIMCVIGSVLITSCGSGGPKAAWDRALGRGKKDSPFVADVSKLKGAYNLTGMKRWDGSGSTTFGIGWTTGTKNVEPNIVLYLKDGSAEIASRTGSPVSTCELPLSLSQGESNRLEFTGNEKCESLSMTIVEQDSSHRFTVRLPNAFDCPRPQSGECTGLTFENVPDFRVGELMYGWELDSIANLPPSVKTLQYPDVDADVLNSIRSDIKSELTASKVELTQDLTLSWMGGFPNGYGAIIVNGSVFSRDELIANAADKVGSFDTQCALVSLSGENVGKFSRSLAELEAAHTNREAGLWTFKQLHTGVDDILNQEQRHTPTENTFETDKVSNHITIRVEAEDSEKNGNGAKLDGDLSISCEKDKSKGPISLADVKKSLGDIVKFVK